ARPARRAARRPPEPGGVNPDPVLPPRAADDHVAAPPPPACHAASVVPVSDRPDNIAVPAGPAAGPRPAEAPVPAVAVPQLVPGDRVQDPFLVTDLAQRSYQGGTMTVLTLGNHTGTIESAPFFDADQAKIAG